MDPLEVLTLDQIIEAVESEEILIVVEEWVDQINLLA